MTSTTGVDARGYLAAFAGVVADMTMKDIHAIPDDKWSATHGGCSKGACDAIADILGMLEWTTEAIKGNLTAVEGSYITPDIKEACSTRDGAAARLAESSSAFGAALTTASDDALNAEVMTPWGMPTPVFMIAQIATSHIWYHDGQLNYIQTLLGDDKVHWMG